MNNLKTQHHHYINNCIGMFYRGLLNFFADEFYPFNYKVISTYNKAVEFFNKHLQEGKEIDRPILPAITLDPSGDFNPDPQGGRFMHQYPNLYGRLGSKMYDPIYVDEQIRITPVFTRFRGTIELLTWFKSVYEYIDFRTLFIMWSGGGENRLIKPEHLWSYIVLPDEILNYEYQNDYLVGEKPYQVDWRTTEAVLTLIRNMNQEKVVYPVLLSPMIKVESITDASEKYGGDDLASYKLNISLTWELDLPTFIHATSDWTANNFKVSVEMGNMHSKYGIIKPLEIFKHINNKNPKYYDLNTLKIYRIVPNQPFVKLIEGDHLTSFPISSDVIDWNPIKSGRLMFISNDSDWDRVEPGDIICAPTFNNSVLPQMRLADGFISLQEDLNQFLKSKISLLHKPAIMNVSNDDLNILRNVPLNTKVTLDPYNRIIYQGELTTELVSKDEPGWGSEVLTRLKEEDPDLQNIMMGLPTDINGIRLNDSTASIDIDTSSIKQRSFYEFSESDFGIEHVLIAITYPIIKPEQVKLVSYIGKLDYDVHYSINFDEQIISLNIPAKENDIVEIYYYG